MTHLLRTPSENVPCTLVGKGYGGEAEIGAPNWLNRQNK